MSRISVDVSSARIPVLQVGYQGENEVTDVLFDISSWITEFGEGVAQLRVKRPGNSEEESYVLSLTITDGIAVWIVSETDTFNKGNGKVQLSYLVGNIVKKAVIYPYKVGKSIVGADNPVDPFDSWIERSKAWAIGETLDGNAVPETDETYQNNAKYYAEQADILGSAQVVLATEQVTLATEKATLATEKADAAAASETNAAASEAAVNGVSTQLTTRMSAIETEQSVQSARMDTFTSLPEGSTSGNAELADIRVGAAGTTYDTAGNAVRGQIGELKSDLSDYKNGYEHMPIISGQYVNGSTGTFHNDNSWSRTDYIDCSKYSTLVFENNTKESNYNAFYNGNKEFVSNLSLDKIGENIITVPQNAKYFVLSNLTSNLNEVLLKSKLNLDIDTISGKISSETDIEFVFEDGYYIDSSTGEKKADSSWKCSNKVELTSGTKRLIVDSTGQDTNNPYNAFYDSDNNRIGRINILSNTLNQVFIIPNNAKYFSVSLTKNARINVKADVLTVKELNDAETEYDNNRFITKRNALNTTIHSISRMGYSDNGYPKESINAFKEAIRMGFDAIRCNYRVTADDVPVSLHDATINSNNARMKNGATITSPVNVDTLTFAKINETYNFSTFGNTIYPITTFEDVVKLCKKTGTTLYVEMKMIPTNEQCDNLINIVKRYGMEKNVQFIGVNASQESVNAIKYIVENSNVSRVGIMLDYFNTTAIQQIGTLNSSNVSVFIWGWKNMDLTEYIDDLVANNIEFEMGTVDTVEGIISYFDTDVNNYCIGVESNYIVASKAIIDSVLLN